MKGDEVNKSFLSLRAGTPLSYSSIKPSVCDKEFCQFRFTEIGIGTSIYLEIKRDPLVADLIISLFAASISDNYCDPKPSNFNPVNAISLFSQLPNPKKKKRK